MDDKYCIPVAFAITLRIARKHIDMTQEGLAKTAGISRSHIVKLENASATPSLSKMMKLCKALNLSLERFASMLEANHSEAVKLLGDSCAETTADALQLYIEKRNNYHGRR